MYSYDSDLSVGLEFAPVDSDQVVKAAVSLENVLIINQGDINEIGGTVWNDDVFCWIRNRLYKEPGTIFWNTFSDGVN